MDDEFESMDLDIEPECSDLNMEPELEPEIGEMPPALDQMSEYMGEHNYGAEG